MRSISPTVSGSLGAPGSAELVAKLGSLALGSSSSQLWAGRLLLDIVQGHGKASLYGGQTDELGQPKLPTAANFKAAVNQTLANALATDCGQKFRPSQLLGAVSLTSAADPNEMVGPSGPTRRLWLRGASRAAYTYTALFQNKPTATAPAEQVTVTDQLETTRLNLATLSLGPVTFGDHVVTPPPGLQSYSTIVDLRPAENELVAISGQLDRATGVISWKLTTLDASTGQPTESATTGFLPPDAVAPEGEGSVSFTVMPKAGLPTGRSIANAATIVFDTNAPITTATWINTIDRSLPTSRILSVRPSTETAHFVRDGRLAAQRVPALLVRWQGTDRASGVASFDLYAAAGGGGFHLVATQTPATAIEAQCVPGRTYRFTTVAHSAVGAVQQGHASPSAPVTCP